MNIGIIGAGFTGLTAALELQKKGHTVTLFEKEAIPGGLAIGFKQPQWEWSLEKHYHHIFTSDKDIQQLAEEVGAKFFYPRPNTSSLIDGEILQLDSPLKLLQFPKLSIIDRLRMGVILAYLKYIASWKTLEGTTAHSWLPKMMGKKGYEMLWEPLLRSKFGEYTETISLAWFWARIKARTTSLGYPEGGFQQLVNLAAEKVTKQGGYILYSTDVQSIEKNGENITVKTSEGEHTFDKVLITVPNALFAKLAPQLPEEYKKKLFDFKSIGAVNMVIELSKPFLPNNVYWLSICQKNYPFLAAVEHTNFIDKKHYDNHHLLYVGNYLPVGHRYFSLTNEELLKEYDASLQKLSPGYEKNILSVNVFKVPFAQPIVSVNYSQKILPFETPIEGVYLANMQQVYPWDRGTNFAVEMGKKVVQTMV
jgi:protoporphyrinogen oxidase